MKVTKKHKELKWNQSIKLLNDIVKIRIGVSSIHGVGIIAMRDMKKGEKLYSDAIPHALDLPYSKFKKLRPEVAEIILSHWPNIINGSHFLYPVTKMNAFMNHSDTPNYIQKADELLCDVKKGDEITVNYRDCENYQKVFKWLK